MNNIIMPRQGQSVESCIITKWHKKVGDSVKIGDMLFSYETDKASFDEEAKFEGVLLKILFGEGADVPCLDTVCFIGVAGEKVDNIATAPTQPETIGAPAAAPVAAQAKPVVATSSNAIPLIMPRQGQSVESCLITKWHKKVGDNVKVGDMLFSYETDKASFDEEAKFGGELLAIFYNEGADVPCLNNVCAVGTKGDPTDLYNPNLTETTEIIELDKPSVTAAQREIIEQISSMAIASSVTGNSATKFVSPRAKSLAKKANIDAQFAIGTGANGRIIERDIDELIKNGVPKSMVSASSDNAAINSTIAPSISSGAEFEEVKLSNVRKVIAKSMVNSLSTMAQLTLNSSFDATDILAFRAILKASKDEKKSAITLNDIVLYAVSRVILRHKEMNAHLLNDSMKLFNVAHLGMAVDTPRGLLVPTIASASKLNLSGISAAAKSLAKAAQGGTINPDQLRGGTFTITNLGSLGIESFTPVINPPQTGILGVNTISTKLKMVGGVATPYQSMALSLTFDHRAVDGAPAGKFLNDLVKYLENFTFNLAQDNI